MAMSETRSLRLWPWLAVAAFALHSGAIAQRTPPPPPVAAATFADLAGLTEQADVVALVEVRDQAVVPPERAPGLAPGYARLYIEARTQALLAGRSALGESLAYLADVPLTEKGKAPKLKKQRFLIYADAVPGRPGELRLVGAQVPANAPTEALARTVIAAFAAPDAPPAVTGIRDVMASGEPVSLTVIRRPGMEPTWGVSWSEIVDQSARPPAPETVEWYRLACFLPHELPSNAFLQTDRASRTRAEADYRYILDQLGECPRLL
jgi:hypothetical protein